MEKEPMPFTSPGSGIRMKILLRCLWSGIWGKGQTGFREEPLERAKEEGGEDDDRFRRRF